MNLNEMLGGEEYKYSPMAAVNDESLACLNSIATARKKREKNKRRFSDEQIRLLESMFESESKLEPRKKLQVAKELGLQPRQVAIWFQNKRARWKSKQLERDYSILRGNYNSLVSRFESLKKEKQALVIQLQKLNEMVQQSGGAKQDSEQRLVQNSAESEADNRDNGNCESEVKPNLSLERSEHGGGVLSDDDSSIRADYFVMEEEPSLLTMVEPVDGCLTSPEDWGSWDSECVFDQSSGSYQWWDFWG